MSSKLFKKKTLRKTKKSSKTRKLRKNKKHRLYKKLVGGDDLLEPEKKIEFQIDKKIFDNYYKVYTLGEGAFGKVYKAKNIDNDGIFAVKVIYLDDESKKQFFMSEIYILNLLKPVCNKNIICYEGSLTEGNTGYIVTDFLDNYVALIDYIQTNLILNVVNEFLVKPTHESKFVKLISDLCEGLHAIHSMSVAHRDIKTENILINRKTWEIKYIDFGLSCYCKGEPLTQTCLLPVGDPNYFDPLLAQYYPIVSQKLNNREIAKNDFYQMNSRYLKSSDLWSLGILMCIIITKTTPYRIITRKYDNLRVSNLSLTDEMKNVYSFDDKLFYYYPFYIQNFAIESDAMKKYLTISNMVFEVIAKANIKLGTKFYAAKMGDLLSLDQNKRKIYIP